ncbi:MAG: tetratricopeptide repeat protein [Chthoniobacterales bacterium]
MRGCTAKWISFLYLAIIPTLFAQTAKTDKPVKHEEANPSPTPENPIGLSMEGRFYAEKGNAAFANNDLKTAKANYEKVLALSPDNILGMVNLGAVYYSLKQYKEAEEILSRAISKQIRTPAAWMTLGLIYMEQSRENEAFAALSFAAAYDPKNARIHNYLGVVAGHKGWYDAAEAELRKALEIDPKLNEANFNLAVFYMERKPPAIELARRHYQRAIELGAEPDPILEKAFEKK